MRNLVINIYPRPNTKDISYIFNSRQSDSTYQFINAVLNYSVQNSTITSTLILSMNEPQTRANNLRSGQPVQILDNGDIILVQNTRYEDLNGKKESSNDQDLAKYWASLGDVFINDAFGTIHRSHASNVGIASYLESAIGFLVEKEMEEKEEDGKEEN